MNNDLFTQFREDNQTMYENQESGSLGTHPRREGVIIYECTSHSSNIKALKQCATRRLIMFS